MENEQRTINWLMRRSKSSKRDKKTKDRKNCNCRMESKAERVTSSPSPAEQGTLQDTTSPKTTREQEADVLNKTWKEAAANLRAQIEDRQAEETRVKQRQASTDFSEANHENFDVPKSSRNQKDNTSPPGLPVHQLLVIRFDIKAVISCYFQKPASSPRANMKVEHCGPTHSSRNTNFSRTLIMDYANSDVESNKSFITSEVWSNVWKSKIERPVAVYSDRYFNI
ncbi:hypothetical protein GCK72_026009 [Caenorhabditis remanei]|nr:hypothetical protein GCK72_026009 [Caenorhabditis remanei]KAF1749541.1 hypothetical protein GCK72_026009 [Caenorhabditis remanei]